MWSVEGQGSTFTLTLPGNTDTSRAEARTEEPDQEEDR